MAPAQSAFCSLTYGSGTTRHRVGDLTPLVTAEAYRQSISFGTEKKTSVVESISFRVGGINRISFATPKPICWVETLMWVDFLLAVPLINSVVGLKLLRTQRLTPWSEGSPSSLDSKCLRFLPQTVQ